MVWRRLYIAGWRVVGQGSWGRGMVIEDSRHKTEDGGQDNRRIGNLELAPVTIMLCISRGEGRDLLLKC